MTLKIAKVAPIAAQWLGALVVALGVLLLAGLGWSVVAAGVALLVLGIAGEVTR